MTPAECVYQSVKHRLNGMEFMSFMAVASGWDFLPIERNGEVCGAVMRKGPEVHIALLPEAQNHTWIRGDIRRELSKVIADHGHAFTWVRDGHTVGHRLAKILGFKQKTNCIGQVRYECTEMAI